MITDIDFSVGIARRESDGRFIVLRPSGPWDVWPDTPFMVDVEQYILNGGIIKQESDLFPIPIASINETETEEFLLDLKWLREQRKKAKE